MEFGSTASQAVIDVFIISYMVLMVVWQLIVKYSTYTPTVVQTINKRATQVASDINILVNQKNVGFVVDDGDIFSTDDQDKNVERFLTVASVQDMSGKIITNNTVHPSYKYWYLGPPLRNYMANLFTMGSTLALKTHELIDKCKFNWIQCSVHQATIDPDCWECTCHNSLKSISNLGTCGGLFHGFIGIFTFLMRCVYTCVQWSVWFTLLIGLNFIFTVLASASPDLQLYMQGSTNTLNCMAHTKPVSIHFDVGIQLQVNQIAACFNDHSGLVKNYPMCKQFGKWDIYNKEYNDECSEFTSLSILSAKQCAGNKDKAVILNVGTMSSVNVMSESMHRSITSVLATSNSYWTKDDNTFMTCNPNIMKNGDSTSDKIELCTLFARTVRGLGSNPILSISLPIVFRFLTTIHHSIKTRGTDDETTLVISMALQGQLLCLFWFHTAVSTFLPHALCDKVKNLSLDVQEKWTTTLQANFEESFLKAFESLVYIVFEVVFTTLTVVMRVLMRMFMASFGEGTQPLTVFISNVLAKPYECVMYTAVTVLVMSIAVVAIVQLVCALAFNMLETCNSKILANNIIQFFCTGLAADLKFKMCTPVIILMISTCVKSLLIIASGGSVPVYSRVLLWGYIVIIGIFDMADVVFSNGFAKGFVSEYFSCLKNHNTIYMFVHCGKKCIEDGRLLMQDINIADIHTRDKEWVEINTLRLITLYTTYAFFVTLWFVYSSLTPYEHGDCVIVRMCSIVFVWFAVSTCSSDTEGCRQNIRFMIKEDTLIRASKNNTWVAEVQSMWPVDIDLPRSTSLAKEGTVAFSLCQFPFYASKNAAMLSNIQDFGSRCIFIGASVQYDHKPNPLVLIPVIHEKYRKAELGMIGELVGFQPNAVNETGHLHIQTRIQDYIRNQVVAKH